MVFISFPAPSSYNYGMTSLSGIPDNSLKLQYRASQERIAALEARLTQLTGELLATRASLDREIAERLSKEDEFRRSTEQLRELSARLQSVREEERTQLARTIHDELGQALTGLKMDVAWLQNHLDQGQPALLEKTQAMSDLTDVIVQVVRRIATELRPGILDLSLVATIEWQLQEFQTRSGIKGELISAPEETTLDVDGATTVFRIFQEILTNVARHAKATQVEVILEESSAFLSLQVHDNGRGITESEIYSPKSIGLLGMRERARLQAGEVHFQGTPGKGTTVTVRLPLSTNN
jgi:signal transduction histidine kinase